MDREQIKQIAIRMVSDDGLINLSRSGLCTAAGIPDGSFPHVMGGSFSEFIEELRAEGINSPLRKVKKSRANPELRKDHILECAVAVAKDLGYTKITLDSVAEAAGVSKSLISRYFSKIDQLKTAVMRQAVRHEIPEIVAQGLVSRDTRAMAAPQELKEKASRFFLGA